MAASHKPSSGKKARLQIGNGLEMGIVGVLVLLFLNLLSWPVAVVDESLDGSWQAILTYSLEHGLRFGEDVIFTYGPLGGFSSFSYSGYNHAGKFAFELLIRLSLVVFVFRFLPNLKLYSKIGFLVLYLFILQFLPDSYETFFFFGMLSWVAAVLLERRKKNRTPWALIGLGAVFLVVCSLVKFTLLVAGLYCTGLVSVFLGLQKRYGEVLVLVAGLPLGFLIAWILLGQHVGDIPGFLAGSSQVARGYAMSMQIATEPQAFKYFLFLLLTSGLLVFLVLRDQLQGGGLKVSKIKQPWLVLLIVYIGLLFMVWKQGVVRSDAHIWQFFCYAPLAGWFLYPLVQNRLNRWLFTGTLVVQTLLMLASIETYYPGFTVSVPSRLWASTRDGIQGLLQPNVVFETMRVKLAARETDLLQQNPLLSRVGGRSVDMAGARQGLLILSGQDYRPRPVFQNYVANNAYLQDLNAAYWESKPTPEAVIHGLDAIDGVFPTQADSQTLLHLLTHYELEAEHADLVLVGKKQVPSTIKRLDGTETRVRLGEPFPLNVSPRRLLLGRVDLSLNWLGKIRAFLYKPPLLHVHVQLEGGDERDFRLNPVTAERDFLLSPLVETAPELWQIREGAAGRGIVSLTLRTDPGQEVYFSRQATFTVVPVQWADGP